MKKAIFVICILVWVFAVIWLNQWQKTDRPFQTPDTSGLTSAQKQHVEKMKHYLHESERGLEYIEQQNH